MYKMTKNQAIIENVWVGAEDAIKLAFDSPARAASKANSLKKTLSNMGIGTVKCTQKGKEVLIYRA